MYIRSCKATRPRGTIVYVHGLGESGLSMEGLISHPRLASWNHLVADLPGYGKSPWPEQPLGFDEQAAVMAELIESRAEDPVVLFGHSMGGVVGQILCERFPERVRAFINVEGNISRDDCTISRRVASYSRDDFLDHGLDKLLDTFYRGGVSDGVFRDYFTSVRMCDPRTYYENSIELIRLSDEERLAERLAGLAVPTVYVLGSPRGTGDRSRDLLSRAGVEWRIVDDAGHWPFADQPEAFLDEMLRFLEK